MIDDIIRALRSWTREHLRPGAPMRRVVCIESGPDRWTWTLHEDGRQVATHAGEAPSEDDDMTDADQSSRSASHSDEDMTVEDLLRAQTGSDGSKKDTECHDALKGGAAPQVEETFEQQLQVHIEAQGTACKTR